jgi:hypothetical protein
VIALKEIHDEDREQQRKTRANLLEIDPNAILPELSGMWAHELILYLSILNNSRRFAILGFERR